MTPQEIIDAYTVVAGDVSNQAAQDAAKIGNSQRSLGTLAERVASPSGQTSGLANYTYNRTLRPVVDTTTAALITQGKAKALETELTNRLLAAKRNYSNAQNNYTVASTKKATDPRQEQRDKEVNTRLKDEIINPDGTVTIQNGRNSNIVETIGGSAVNLVNTFSSLLSGNVNRTPRQFAYDLNGVTHTGVFYPGQGAEIDGFSFTLDGIKNHLAKQAQHGASNLRVY